MNSFFLRVWTAYFSTEQSVWPFFPKWLTLLNFSPAAHYLDRLESKSPTGQAAAQRATCSVESTARVCDCHWHGVQMVQTHVCGETAGVTMFGSCWGDWVTGSPRPCKTSWPALEFNVDEVSFGVLYYGNSTASSHNLKHQTKKHWGVFVFFRVSCQNVRLRVKMFFITVCLCQQITKV